MEDKEGNFVDKDGRRRNISEEDASRYKNIANDIERIDRKFCKSYEQFLVPITCAMAQCGEVGCALKIYTKGHEFRERTTARSRGSAKGTKCGKYATFQTFLQQWFSLGITVDIMRQANEKESIPITDEGRYIEIKGMNDRAIALIAKIIKNIIDTVKMMEQYATADKAAQAARAKRMANAEKDRQDLLHNLSIMQQTLDAAVSCREIDQEFSEKNIIPPSQSRHTPAFHPVRGVAVAEKMLIWPAAS